MHALDASELLHVLLQQLQKHWEKLSTLGTCDTYIANLIFAKLY